jgi:PLP dependent protein
VAKKTILRGEVKTLIFKGEAVILNPWFLMISDAIEGIRQRVRLACQRSGRSEDSVTLVGVTKTFPAELVREAAGAGVQDIGENYVQEVLAKRNSLADLDIRWHFIGHLQSNKVRQVVPWVHLIHAVDNLGVAGEIDRRAKLAGRVIDILVEVNTTGEESKFGIAPGETPGFVRSLADLTNVKIAGLMTIGPFLPDPEGSRPMFRTLRNLRDQVAALGQANVEMRHLSMGMTGDFEVAIEEGATLIRIGTGIFGSRTRRS